MKNQEDFAETFVKLKAILEPYAAKMIVVHDTDKNYYLDTSYVMKNKQRMFFGVTDGEGVRQFSSDTGLLLSGLARQPHARAEETHAGQVVFQFQNG